MSQPSASKGKDNTGKKYASLNVNQTYKGTKVENRSAAGQPRHGLQSLGKVAQNRRLPLPANLPSLKKENLGNDPTVNLVPTGSSGWGKKEKNTAARAEEPTQAAAPQKQPKSEPAPEISLRPNAGVALKNQSDQGKGWSNLQTTTGSVPQPPANSFQREFPRLGGDSGGQRTQESAREQESDERVAANDAANMQARLMGGPGPGQVPVSGPPVRPGGPRMDFNFQRDQQRPIFNGPPPPMQGPGSQFYPPFHPGGMVPPYMHMMAPPLYSYPYPQNRMAPPTSTGQPPRPATTKAEATDRPATVKQEDIQSMDDDIDDGGGWAGAQEEVDYSAKLKFDESDEEQETPSKSSEGKAKSSSSNNVGYSEDRSADGKSQSRKEPNDNRPTDGRPEAWGEQQPPAYPGQMQFRHPGWIRTPYPPQYDPSRGPPPQQGYAPYPAPWMYPMPPHGNFRMQGIPPQRGAEAGTTLPPPVSGPPVSMHHGPSSPKPSADKPDVKETEKQSTERKNVQPEDREESERRAKAAAKLHALEVKIKIRDEAEKIRRDSESSSKSGRRERFDSENSDSSKGGAQRSYTDKYNKSARETPPRFLKQQSKSVKGTKSDSAAPVSAEASGSFSSSESGPVPRIMKRRDSLKSDDASSVHSQDSWVNPHPNEKGTNKDDADDEAVFVDRQAESDSGKDRPQSKALSKEKWHKDERQTSRSSKEDRQTTKKDYASGGSYSQQSREVQQESKDYRETKNYNGDGREAKYHKERKQGRNKAEPKSDSKKYEYRQDKAKFKDYRVDNRQGKKEQEFENRSQPSKDDKRYGRESKRDEVEGKIDGDLDSKSYQRDRLGEVDVEYRSTQERGSQKADAKIQKQPEVEGKSKDRSQETKSESDDYKFKASQRAKPMADNFKKLEKPKNKNISMKESREKTAAAKVQQKQDMENKKPSAWSQVVSGATSDDTAVPKNDLQPKKSLREIQEEEEKRETEMNKSIEKEQERAKQEDQEKRAYEQDTRMPFNDRRNDDRYNRRGYHDRNDDKYHDTREGYERRRPDYNRERRPDEQYENKSVDRPDTKPRERYDQGGQSSAYASRNERGSDSRKTQRDDRKRNAEDRKRKHDDTERNEEVFEKNDKEYSDDETEIEKTRTYEGRGNRKDYYDRQTDQNRYPERGRGSRGGRASAYPRGGGGRGGRDAYANRAAGNRDNYNSRGPQNISSESLPEKAQAPDETNDHEVKADGKDAARGKENRGPEGQRGKGFGVPPKRSEDRYRDAAKNRDRQGYYEYSGTRQDPQRSSESSRRGRGYSNTVSGRSSTKRDSTHEGQQVGDSGKSDQRTEDREDKQSSAEKTAAVEITPSPEGDDRDCEGNDEYTDEEGQSDDNGETGNAGQSKEKPVRDHRSDGNMRGQGRGSSRGQVSNRGQRPRNNYEDRRYEGSYKTEKVAPRFQKQKESFSDSRRGEQGYSRVRGSRSRGKAYQAYGTRGRGFGRPDASKLSKSRDGSKHEESRDNDLSGDSDDDTFHSAEDFVNSGDEKQVSKDVKHSKEYDPSKRYSTRGKYPSMRGGSARGRGRAGRGGNSNHFLADRQQERVSHIDSSGWAVTPPAAGKASFAGSRTAEEKPGAKLFSSGSTKRNGADGKMHATSEALSDFSEPPKKMAKSKITEKVDILRQFDVNNIASVVCIDDMPQNCENVETLSQTEDDGFVQVTSRKAQKVMRERQKEEEKRKLHEFSSKSTKKSSSDSKEAVTKPGKPSKFADHNSQRVTQNYAQSSGQVTVPTVTQSQTSNAAMAAVGGWEPAQALLRGVQSAMPVDNLSESGKSVAIPAPPPSMNAWVRPLSFASSLASTTTTNSHSTQPLLPDPKAVGTGKPNSSPAKQVPAGQAAPSGDVILTNGVPSVYNELVSEDAKFQQPITGENDELNSDMESKPTGRKGSLTRSKTESRKINKGTKRETAPRFQNMTKGKGMPNPRMVNGDGAQQKKKVSATAEDVAVLGFRTLHGDERTPGKRPDASKLRRCNSESGKEEPVSGLPPAEHSEQPAISFIQDDPQSSIRNTDKTATEKIRPLGKDTLKEQKVEVSGRSKEEDNAKDTSRSVIKSLGGDDEKNLETRSLPSSTPPLAVEIHAPRTSGPSSDPGKANAMPASSYMAQEVDEMSMKVLSAKKIWDNIPSSVAENLSVAPSSNARTAWSEEEKANGKSSAVTSMAPSSREIAELEVSPVKENIVSQTPVAVVAAQNIKNSEDDAEAANEFITKKTVIEQQNNVCKVKPQQKQHQQQNALDDKQLITSLTNSQLFPSQFAFQQSFALPLHSTSNHSKVPQQQPYMLSLERQHMPDTTSNSVMYSQREAAHRDLPNQHPQPPVNMQQVNQVRPTSPLSHQMQDPLQPSMMLSNIYGTQAMQGTQQSPVLWPVISRHAMQPTTSLSYLSQHQNHERTSDVLNSSPLYMTFDQGNSSMLSTQRFNSQMQQAPALGLVLPQQTLRSGSMLGLMQANQSSKENAVFSMSPTPSPFHQMNDLQLGGPSHSDLTKHVNAKPFQPSSKTPPGVMSSQMLSHQQQAQLMHQQQVQAKFISQYNKLVGPSVNLQQHMSSQQMSEHHHSGQSQADKHSVQQQHQAMHHHSLQQQSQVLAVQPHGALAHSAQQHSSLSLQQHVAQQGSGQQHFMQHHSFQSPHIAAVGPRSVQSRAISSVSPSVPSQKRIEAMSPVEASLQFIHGPVSSGNSAGQGHHHGSLMQQGNQGANIVQVLQPAQSLPTHSPQTRPFIVRPSVQTFSKYQRAVPGPIQRPPRPSGVIPVTASNRPKQPVLPIVKEVGVAAINKSSVQPTSGGATGNNFRSEQHQKMIEETRKYFASQNKAEPASSSQVSIVPVVSASSVVTPTVPAQVVLARPAEKDVVEEKIASGKEEAVDIPAAAMLNDPSDIDSIIKSQPSLAKALRGSGKQERVAPHERTQQKKPQDKEEKSRRASSSRNSANVPKPDQKTGVAKPLPQRSSDRSKRAHKPHPDSNRGKQ